MVAALLEAKSPGACRGHLTYGAWLIVTSAPAATPHVNGRDVPKSPGREIQTPVVWNLARVDGVVACGAAHEVPDAAHRQELGASGATYQPWDKNGPGAELNWGSPGSSVWTVRGSCRI